ncbi:MAG: hypothetical protein HYU99_10025, partial [Deltaproteobacteria bacterium]|nr:hypothetical protein [Deltaproteobacteria bacterium]
RAALDPDFVTDDASVWLEFFISTLVALDRDAFRRREKPKEGYPVEMDRAKLFIDSLRLKPGTALSLYETEFEVACDHASEADEGAHEGDNLISGVVDIGSGVLRMKMDSVDRLHIVMPGENGDNLVDLMLRDGSIGEIEMRKDNGASILKISDMNFARANLDGKLFKDKVKLQVISNLRMNEMEIREGGVDDADQTVVFADFNAELEKGYIRFQKGERKAHFDMGPSPIHVKSLFKFDEVVRDQPSAGGKKDSHPGHQPRRQTVDTVLASTEFDITSDRLAFSRVNLSPGIVFDRAVTHNAHIVLKNGPGGEGEELNLTGRFDWEMGQSFTVPLAEVRLIPRLTPELTFDSMTVKGPGQLLFEDERVFFGTIREGEKIPMALKEGTLRVGYAGALSMRHVPLPSMPEYVTDLKGRFQGSTEYRTGRFFLDENGVILPLHVEEMSADVVFIRFFDLNGKVYVESPSPEGVSGWSFVNGKGQFSAVSARIKEAGWAQYEGAQLQLYDQGPHRNSVMMQGNLEVRNKVFVFDNLDLEADLYDEVNDVWMRGIKIKSQSSPLATLFALPPTALATGYRKSSSEE